ncbi:MAG: ketoacyl-ACP synthase III [Chloroflexi bacterium]|nr:ketoacyl-ACP synthase III [Chloroflexota bacterium]
MNKRYGRITGWGKYAPEKAVTNYDLEKTLDTSHEWIVQRSGIERRHIAGPDETTATMSVQAGIAALNKAELKPADLDLIIVATSSPDHLTPPVSSQVQHMLGATNVPAFVLVTGCTGFLYALVTAQQFVQTGAFDNILIVGVELLSRYIDWNDRSTAVLFGDAAGAVIMQPSSEPCGIESFELGSDGSGAEHLIVPAMGTAEPVNEKTFAEGRCYLRMNGREVFKFATRILGRSAGRVLAKAGMTLDDIDWFVPHQANLRIIQMAAKSMGVSLDRFIINIPEYANTSAATIPVALAEALDDGRIQLHDKLLLASFGAGLTWATAVMQLAPTPNVSSNGVGALARGSVNGDVNGNGYANGNSNGRVASPTIDELTLTEAGD